MKYAQKSFSGGLNRQFDPTKIADDEYPLLINGRVRNNQVEVINLPEELTDGLPEGNNVQGLYSAGFYLLVFIDGNAYYRSFNPDSPDTSFTKINGFSLDPDVERIYCELVPGSSINFKRKAVTDGIASDGVNLTSTISGSPDCAYVTDGINQGRIIFPDASSRETQTWDEWQETTDGELREYVPVGKFPLYQSGILYQAVIDTASGRLNRIVRSVTGRPLDYMVIVDQNGNKLPTIQEGGADVVSHRVDYNTITGLARVSLIQNPQTSINQQSPILVSTAYNSYLVMPNLDKLVYGEPTFSNQFLFSTGMLNPFCVIDEISGDTLMIDSKGIISFNATSYAKAEGRNLPFSRKIHPLFNGITQTVACTSKVDNYIYFGVNTVYGPAIVVYDEITQKWISVDLYPGVNLIKQFAVISTTTVKRLFFITIDNKLYEAFASNDVATCRIYCGEWMEDDKHQRVLNIQAAFTDILTQGEVHATLFTDGLKFKRNIQEVEINQITSSLPLALPFGRSDKDSVLHLTFGFQDAPIGYKHGILLEWNCKAILSNLMINTSEIDPLVDIQQDSLIEQNKTQLNNSTTIAFVGWLGLASTQTAQLVAEIKSQNPNYVVLVGNNNQPAGALATLQANVKDYWDQMYRNGKVYAALGPKDLDTLNGQAQLEYFLQGRYFRTAINSDVELFILNSGYNSTGVLKEPDGTLVTQAQALWLKQALADSSRKWKVVVVWDTPIYSTVGFNSWPFKQWGASMVIGAKHQNYERLFQDQFSQINIGSGSSSLEGFPEPYTDGSKYRYNSARGYFILEVDSINLNGTFYALGNSQPIDQLQILG